jgi:hypothetical protein
MQISEFLMYLLRYIYIPKEAIKVEENIKRLHPQNPGSKSRTLAGKSVLE